MAISCHFIDLLNEYSLQIMEQRINSEVKIIVLLKPMNNPLGVSPSKEKQGPHEAKKKSRVRLQYRQLRRLLQTHLGTYVNL